MALVISAATRRCTPRGNTLMLASGTGRTGSSAQEPIRGMGKAEKAAPRRLGGPEDQEISSAATAESCCASVPHAPDFHRSEDKPAVVAECG